MGTLSCVYPNYVVINLSQYVNFLTRLNIIRSAKQTPVLSGNTTTNTMVPTICSNKKNNLKKQNVEFPQRFFFTRSASVNRCHWTCKRDLLSPLRLLPYCSSYSTILHLCCSCSQTNCRASGERGGGGSVRNTSLCHGWRLWRNILVQITAQTRGHVKALEER